MIDGGGDCAFNSFYLLLQQPASVKYDVNLKERTVGLCCFAKAILQFLSLVCFSVFVLFSLQYLMRKKK